MKAKNFKFFVPIMAIAIVSSTASFSLDKTWLREAVLVEGIEISKHETVEKAKSKTKEKR